MKYGIRYQGHRALHRFREHRDRVAEAAQDTIPDRTDHQHSLRARRGPREKSLRRLGREQGLPREPPELRYRTHRETEPQHRRQERGRHQAHHRCRGDRDHEPQHQYVCHRLGRLRLPLFDPETPGERQVRDHPQWRGIHKQTDHQELRRVHLLRTDSKHP